MNFDTAGIFAASSVVWPLCFLFIALLVLRQLKEDVRPIFVGMVGTLQVQSSKYAFAWMFALLTATLASLQALQEVAQQLHWIYIGVIAKVMQPGLAVLVAYGRQGPNPPANGSTGGTNPPFPKT